LLRYRRDEAWATLVSFLGLPGEPAWADHILGVIEDGERIKALDGLVANLFLSRQRPRKFLIGSATFDRHLVPSAVVNGLRALHLIR
jgi:hypothetical protein